MKPSIRLAGEGVQQRLQCLSSTVHPPKTYTQDGIEQDTRAPEGQVRAGGVAKGGLGWVGEGCRGLVPVIFPQ